MFIYNVKNKKQQISSIIDKIMLKYNMEDSTHMNKLKIINVTKEEYEELKEFDNDIKKEEKSDENEL